VASVAFAPVWAMLLARLLNGHGDVTDEALRMSTVPVALDSAVVDLLRRRDQPIERSVLELILVELVRRHEISRGRAAELLGMSQWDFIDYAARLGIPYFDMTKEEWDAEVARLGTE
jgi:predicted HTH domain antitoxin